ncbi:Uncharacterised protein [Mycobacterium tuberculosis]|nr:Uncharacterised protein [Mycobacterium tuberculosis]
MWPGVRITFCGAEVTTDTSRPGSVCWRMLPSKSPVSPSCTGSQPSCT